MSTSIKKCSRLIRFRKMIPAMAGLALACAAVSPASAQPQWDNLIGQPGFGQNVLALAIYDDGNGPALYAGGDFATVFGAPADRIAKWDGTSWVPVGGGTNGSVRALAVYQPPSGPPVLVAAGSFLEAGGISANRVAAWDGTSWSALGAGLTGSFANVWSLGHYQGDLIAGGTFTTAGGISANRVARWDGSSWSNIGTGVSNSGVSTATVHAIAEFAGDLYIGGVFDAAGPTALNHIARWNGVSWSSPGTGLGLGPATAAYALTVFDDGSGGGPALYVGGNFGTAGGVTASSIARWNGSSWSGVGGGVSNVNQTIVRSLTLFDDGCGSGTALYVAGAFTTAGTTTVNHIARWNGSSWSALGSGIGGVSGLFANLGHNDPLNPVLYVAGSFTQAGGLPANNVASWLGCPGTGHSCGNSPNNCCVQSPVGTPFCNDAACCNAVCANNPSCCNGSWDALCAGQAQNICAVCATGPANELCSNATSVGLIQQLLFDNFGAVTDGPPEPAPCGFTGVDDSDVWFEFIAPVDGQHRVTAHAHPAGPSPARHLAVYDGSCPAAGGPNLGCQSAVVAPVSVCFDAFAGDTYIIRVGTPGGAAGQSMFLLDVEYVPCIGVQQLLALLACWGPVTPGSPCAAWNFTGTGIVSVLDLLHLLANWGCPVCP